MYVCVCAYMCVSVTDLLLIKSHTFIKGLPVPGFLETPANWNII